MSDTGIYAGGYQRVRDYAESVDRLLLDLKSGHAPTDEILYPVVSLLEALENHRNAPAAVQVIGTLLQGRKALIPARLKGIVSDLKSRHPSPATVEGLEEFAAILDEERATISARLHGV
jgi:hypothetical protein